MGDDHTALICDFGLSHLKEGQRSTTISNAIQGTLNFMAPERFDAAPVNYPADVYSFAMTAWQIHTGLVPFPGISLDAFHLHVIEQQERPEYPNSMNKTLWTLIQDCWQPDPTRRPTFSGIEASLQPISEPCTQFSTTFSST